MIAVISLVLRIRTSAIALLALPVPSRTVQGFITSAIDTLYSHPAQLSIGWDVIWTSVSFVVWMGIKPSREGVPASNIAVKAPFAIAAASLASLAVATPWVLRERAATAVEPEQDSKSE